MSKLEVAERVAVIGGALLGALAFSWQIADSWANQKETLAFSTGWRHAGDSATHFSVEIINKSSRPVFLRDADIDIPIGWLGPGIREVERVS